MKCYLCGKETALYLIKNDYKIYRCSVCGLAQTNLGENYQQFLEKQYAKGYFTGDPSKKAYEDYRHDEWYIKANHSKFLSHLKKHKPSGKLLDIGCAMGYFVDLALKNGYDAYGIDVSDYAINIAKKTLGDRVQEGTIDTVKYTKNSFDIITLFDVFEHLNDPIGDILKMREFLKTDGIILIATGNTDSSFAKLSGRKWTFYNPPQHLFFLSKKNLQAMLAKAGYKPLEWFSVSKILSIRYVLHLARTVGENKFAQWLYPVFHRTILGKLPLLLPTYDNMIVVASKL